MEEEEFRSLKVGDKIKIVDSQYGGSNPKNNVYMITEELKFNQYTVIDIYGSASVAWNWTFWEMICPCSKFDIDGSEIE